MIIMCTLKIIYGAIRFCWAVWLFVVCVRLLTRKYTLNTFLSFLHFLVFDGFISCGPIFLQ